MPSRILTSKPGVVTLHWDIVPAENADADADADADVKAKSMGSGHTVTRIELGRWKNWKMERWKDGNGGYRDEAVPPKPHLFPIVSPLPFFP